MALCTVYVLVLYEYESNIQLAGNSWFITDDHVEL